MFTRHSTDFAAVTSAQAVKGAMFSLSVETIVETRRGWRKIADVRPSDEIASLDGGFVPLSWVRQAIPTPNYHIPAQALGNCDDMVLPSDSRIGRGAPLNFTHASTDMLSAPIRAFEGYRGIRKVTASETTPSLTIGLAAEEMLWVQSGLLIHARPMTTPYFHTLSFAEACALIALESTSPDCIPVAA
ncbi:MAG: hypothetical protein ABJL99_08985 [Aliishimia sp.]